MGLFAGARRWLGQYGGTAAVVLFCSSGAAMLFAWRDYMPTFTDASLIAAGAGALLWAVLAADATTRRRTWAGLAGFVAIEAAVFVRYANAVVLVVAVCQASRDAGVGLALAASWFSVWGLCATYTWTASPGLNTLQAARFYLSAVGAIALLGAWLAVRLAALAPVAVPGRVPMLARSRHRAALGALTSVAVVAAIVGLGIWNFSDMRGFGRGHVVRGPHGVIGVTHGGPPGGAPGRAPAGAGQPGQQPPG
ncbi:MAG TPA: hypothetical protein VMU94_08765 [Streptosporangiaceae bacterium]|nr:hypothetical protein [Streptosporangiaceae bacterium]